jgi:4-diphosphocytidyl-2-C-methyl-D-erythritol kinase
MAKRMSLHVLAHAKLNLTLTITGRRPDGYHALESLFAFTALADAITVEDAKDVQLAGITGDFGREISGNESNLLIRAARLLQAEAGVRKGALIRIDKRIPVAAGLGGGSADAAAMLRALNRCWGLDWPIARLETLAAALGADVPACIRSAPVLAFGVGDILRPAPAMPDCGILLVNPRIQTPTPAVFKAFREQNPVVHALEQKPFPPRFSTLDVLVAAIALRGNDLLGAAVSVTPVIADVLKALERAPNAAYASLSGSGATCFTLFATQDQAAEAARGLADAHPGWWSWSGRWAQ